MSQQITILLFILTGRVNFCPLIYKSKGGVQKRVQEWQADDNGKEQGKGNFKENLIGSVYGFMVRY